MSVQLEQVGAEVDMVLMLEMTMMVEATGEARDGMRGGGFSPTTLRMMMMMMIIMTMMKMPRAMTATVLVVFLIAGASMWRWELTRMTSMRRNMSRPPEGMR